MIENIVEDKREVYPMDLILIGGVQGTGKTTIFERLKGQFNAEVLFLDPGELFRKLCYDKGGCKTADEVEEIILGLMLSAPSNTTIVAHWHYAVPRAAGFIPQISFSRLSRLARSGRLSRVSLVSIEPPVEIIRQRRLLDPSGKKRNLFRPMIEEEVRRDREFMDLHREYLSEIIGRDSVTPHYFSNEMPEEVDYIVRKIIDLRGGDNPPQIFY